MTVQCSRSARTGRKAYGPNSAGWQGWRCLPVNEYKLLGIPMVLFSAQIACTYLNSFHNGKKARKSVGWTAWGTYIVFQYWAMASNASRPLLVLIINMLLIFFVYKASYHVSYKTALFRAGILYVLWMLVEVGTNYMLGKTGTAEMSYGFIVGNVISQIVMYILVHVLKRCRKSDSLPEISLKYWMRLFLIPLVTIYVIHNTFHLTVQNQRNIFFLITTILMILVNYVTFDVYDKLGSQLETEKKNLAYEQQIALCNKQAAEREAAYQETRRVRHDLNGYLVDLKAVIQSGRLDEAESKINAILENNQIYKNEVSRSGNLVIDSLINYKYSLALKEGIDMKCYVFVPEQMSFDGADLCIILGNLIDNAMEAAGNLPEGQRHMEVSVSQVKESLTIMVQNPYEGKIRRNDRGQLLTSKRDSINHGIGLSSVQRKVDKYNGELLTDYENGLFRATVLLYPPENLHTDS